MKLPLKPGHTTTEFWAVIIGGLLTTGIAAISLLDVAWAAMAIAGMTIAYNVSRQKVKTIQAQAEASIAITEAEIKAYGAGGQMLAASEDPEGFVPQPPPPLRPLAPHSD